MSLKHQMARCMELIQRYGAAGVIRKAAEKFYAPEKVYHQCWQKFQPDEAEQERQREVRFSYEPKISIVVPAYETDECFLRPLIDSVLNQTYRSFELVIADGSDSSKVSQVVESYEEEWKNYIVYKHLEHNGGISDNTNEGFAMAGGDYIGLLDHDDLLSVNALFEMVQCINRQPEADRNRLLCYSDEDKISADGKEHSYVHLKPDYNEELIRHYNYICHFVVFSRELLQRAGGLDTRKNGSQDYDFVLRCISAGATVLHVPKVLYHWRVHEASTSSAASTKLYAYEAGAAAVGDYLKRKAVDAKVTISRDLGIYDVQYELPDKDSICFVSSLDNRTVQDADADYLAYLGSNVECDQENWQQHLAGFCMEADVAMAGSRTIAGSRVMQCGLLVNESAEIIPAFCGLVKEYRGYFNRARLPQDVTALSLDAAIVLKKSAFLQVGGMDEAFVSPYRELDLIYKLRESGYRIVLAADLDAAVKNVKNRKCDDKEALEQSRIRFLKKWETVILKGNPFYHPEFTYEKGGYRLKE